ncbi:AMP-binding protein [Pararhodobacter marinus]|uniref:AMP-binding protein n=1 Tax=Pararhodobacter marinus TaxID=2184063 RepID=UPI003512B3D6
MKASTRLQAIWPAHIPMDIAPITAGLDQVLQDAAARHPDKAAFLCQSRAMTFAQLDRKAGFIAGFLQQRGRIAQGDRVGLLLPDGPDFIAAFFGILRAGAIAVPFDPTAPATTLAERIEQTGLRVILAAAEQAADLLPLADDLRLDRVILAPRSGAPSQDALAPSAALTGWGEMLNAAIDPEPVETRPEDPCLLLYGPEQSGPAMACLHTHRSALHAAACLRHWLGAGDRDLCLSALPLSRPEGLLAGAILPVVAGATGLLMPKGNSKREGCKALDDVTILTGCAATNAALLDQTGNSDNLRRVWTFDGRAGLRSYGQAETMGLVAAELDDNPALAGAGIPCQNTQILIVDPQTRRRAAQGRAGEILIRGPQVMARYWNDPRANTLRFRQIGGLRYFRTGDLGLLAGDGRLHVTGRLEPRA